MRIVHISKYYHPYVGGVENVCKYLADHSAGNEVAVVCFNEGRANSVDIVDGIKVYRVGVLFHIARQAVSLKYHTVLRHVIRDFCPDLIQFHWANPFPAALRRPAAYLRRSPGGHRLCGHPRPLPDQRDPA